MFLTALPRSGPESGVADPPDHGVLLHHWPRALGNITVYPGDRNRLLSLGDRAFQKTCEKQRISAPHVFALCGCCSLAEAFTEFKICH